MPVVVENPCVPALPAHIDGGRGSTPRTARLAADVIDHCYGPFVELQALGARCPAAPEDEPLILRQARGFAFVHPRQTPIIREGELIVGARVRAQEGPPGGCWYPEGYTWYIEHFARNVPPDRPDLAEAAGRGLISPQGSFNHKVVDYAGFLRTGSAALAARARSMAEEREGDERAFCEAFALGHEAMMEHADTYAAACERLADSGTEALADPARAAELREIARICRKVPAAPAETFHEAIQSFWFAYLVAGDATGRIDVYLNDFYQADLAAGRITEARAQELIECLLIKLHGDIVEGVVNVSSIQTMTLGGLLPDGTDGCNDLTRLFLRAIRAVRLLRPTVYLRCTPDTPDALLTEAMEMLGEGLTEPSFYGDKPIVEGLVRIGVPLEHARDYALSGCTEVVSPGRGNWGAPNGWINLALLTDEAIRHAAAAGAAGPEALWSAVNEHVERVADLCRDANAWVDDQVNDTRYAATLLMPCCLDRCKDVAHGGAETYYGHWEAIGLPNAADMLTNALRLAADAPASLPDALGRLDAGDAALTARLRRGPRYGTGDDEVDQVAARLIDLMADALERRSTPLRTKLVLGHLAGGENMHIGYGAAMGATLDGRKQGQTLADSLAGSQGCTQAGPTAAIRSLCALDHSKMIAGNVSTLRLPASDLADPEGRDKVKALVRAFVAMGGSQLQINSVDAATLRAAQERPEEHRGLLVRVAGYSADFTSIGKALQDEIIARTEGIAEEGAR